ncbi:DUF4405 domain-containing protein [Nanoarchaeota archaeon]
MVNKAKLNYLIDIGLIITFISVATTGIIKFPGLLSKFSISYRNLPMRQISILHDWSGIVMAALVLVHIALNWNFLVCMTKSFFKKQGKKKVKKS